MSEELNADGGEMRVIAGVIEQRRSQWNRVGCNGNRVGYGSFQNSCSF